MNAETNRRAFLKQATATVGALSVGGVVVLSGCGGGGGEGGAPVLQPFVPPPALTPQSAVTAVQSANIAPVTSVTVTVQKTLTAADAAALPTTLSLDPSQIVFPALDATGKIIGAQTAASLGVSSADLLTLFQHLVINPQPGDMLVTNTYTVNGTTYATLALTDSQGRIKFDPFIGLLPPNANVPGSIQQQKATQGVQNKVGMASFNPVTGAPVFQITADVVRNLDSHGQPIAGAQALTVSNIKTVLGPGMQIETGPTVDFHNKSVAVTRDSVVCQVLNIATEVCNFVSSFVPGILGFLLNLLCTILSISTDICVNVSNNTGGSGS